MMRVGRHRIWGVVVTIAAALCLLGLYGCGGSGGSSADNKFAGTWQVESWVDSTGNEHNADACDAMRDLGLDIVMRLDEGGKVSYSQWGQEEDGSWEASGDKGSLSSDGQILNGGDLELQDDKLVASWEDGTRVTFARNDDAKATAGDYQDALLGKWEIISSKTSKGSYKEDTYDALRQSGNNLVLTLNADSTALLVSKDGAPTGTWTFKNPSTASLSIGGDNYALMINGNAVLVIMSPDGSVLGFRKNPNPTMPQVTTTSTDSGASGQSAAGVNADSFKAVQNGMSYQDVVGVFGSEGKLTSESNAGGMVTRVYEWEANGWGIAQVTLTNDKVVNKTQIGVSGDSAAAVTAAQFEKVSNGMSYEDVVAIMGGEGQLVSDTNIAGSSMQIYSWDGKTLGSNCTISFLNDKVNSKSQIGLK